MRLIDLHIKEIIKLLHKCNDADLLDFIYHLLQKHRAQH